MAVNSTTWKRLPIAPRETTFNADETIARISAWAKSSTERFAMPFLWQNSDGPANNKNSYRLPIADIVNGRMVLIPHAVFSAAAIMSGAHGGLEDAVQSEQERVLIKRTLTEIYDVLRSKYGDRRLDAPWLKGRTLPEQAEVRKSMGMSASAGAQLIQDLNAQTRSSQQAADQMNLRGRIKLLEGQKLLSSRSFSNQNSARSNVSPAMAIIHDPDEGRELRIAFLDLESWDGEDFGSVSLDQRGIDEFRRNSASVAEAINDHQADFTRLIEDIESFGGFDGPTLDLTPEQMAKVEKYWKFADDGTIQEGTMTSGFDGDIKYRIYGNESGQVGIQVAPVHAGDTGNFERNPEVGERSTFFTTGDWDAFFSNAEEFFEEDIRVDPDTRPDEEFFEDDEGDDMEDEDDLMASMQPGMVAAVNSSGWSSMPVASIDASWDGPAAKEALWQWAGGDYAKFRKGFLYWDASRPDVRGSYKLPVARPEDGELTVIPAAVNAVVSVLGGGRGGVDIPVSDKARIRGIVSRLQKRFQKPAEGTTAAIGTSVVPTKPPRDWLLDPNLQGPTPLTVSGDGRVFGHVAAWDQCHTGMQDRCVMAPRNHTGYRYFKQGSVLTAEGDVFKVGVITGRTNHASASASMQAAIDHYANTGSTMALINVGEDQWGIWAAGVAVPGSTEEDLQEIRRHPLSGHWAPVHGSLELVNALAVNHPGFPIYSMTASGELEGGLIAVGVVMQDGTISHPDQPVEDDRIERLAKIDAKLHEERAKRLLGEDR